MHVITAHNVNDALVAGLWWLQVSGRRDTSRNGTVLVSKVPVTTAYLRPTQRVLFAPLRDANPFFHLMESLWMLAGRDDVKFPASFAKQIAEYSDNGTVLNGAYGHRWRSHFEYDQLPWIVNELRRNPHSRRCVLSMWDGASDPYDVLAGSKDVPCNTHAYFLVNDGKLDMTVCCRSNDAIWGAYGANAVHFSFLMEYIAAAVGVAVGTYYQISNNYHVYIDRPDVQRLYCNGTPIINEDNRYTKKLRLVPLMNMGEARWQVDLMDFMEDCDAGMVRNRYSDMFFSDVAAPMMYAHTAHKAGDHAAAMRHMNYVLADDWRMAGMEWLIRREMNRAK